MFCDNYGAPFESLLYCTLGKVEGSPGGGGRCPHILSVLEINKCVRKL